MDFIDKLQTRPPSPIPDQKVRAQHERNVSTHEAKRVTNALNLWLQREAPQRWLDGQHLSFPNNAASSPHTDDSRESWATRNRSPLSDISHVQRLKSTPPSTANSTPQIPSTKLKRKRSPTALEDRDGDNLDSHRKRVRLGLCKQEPGHFILTRMRTRIMRASNKEVQFHALEDMSRKAIAQHTTLGLATTH